MIEINEDNFMFGFLGVTLFISIVLLIGSNDILNILYFMVMIYHFIKFLIIRER